MNNKDKSFLDLTEMEISKAIEGLGEQKYRTDQLDDWIYKKHVRSWTDMNNLPLKFINELDSLFKGCLDFLLGEYCVFLSIALLLPNGDFFE